VPPIRSHPALARHLAQSLVYDEFDLAVFQDLPLDHGCNSPLTMLWPTEPDWPGRLVPVAINVLQHPLPTALRCYKLGRAVRRAVESYPEDLKVAIVGTGGLSHQMSGARAGFNNTEWDLRFLDLIERDPQALAAMTHAEYARLGGTEGAEVIMWLAMRGALAEDARKVHQSYYLPMTTAMAVALFEEPATGAPPAPGPVRHSQLDGLDALPGTYLFDLERSAAGLRLNRFLHGLTAPENRALFRDSPDAAFGRAGLTPAERRLVRDRDWHGLVRYGASFFTLEKLARVSGVSNPEMVAAMRGEPLDEFLKTRNVPGAR
jgi:gallate dioxygenase